MAEKHLNPQLRPEEGIRSKKSKISKQKARQLKKIYFDKKKSKKSKKAFKKSTKPPPKGGKKNIAPTKVSITNPPKKRSKSSFGTENWVPKVIVKEKESVNLLPIKLESINYNKYPEVSNMLLDGLPPMEGDEDSEATNLLPRDLPDVEGGDNKKTVTVLFDNSISMEVVIKKTGTLPQKHHKSSKSTNTEGAKIKKTTSRRKPPVLHSKNGNDLYRDQVEQQIALNQIVKDFARDFAREVMKEHIKVLKQRYKKA